MLLERVLPERRCRGRADDLLRDCVRRGVRGPVAPAVREASEAPSFAPRTAPRAVAESKPPAPSKPLAPSKATPPPAKAQTVALAKPAEKPKFERRELVGTLAERAENEFRQGASVLKL